MKISHFFLFCAIVLSVATILGVLGLSFPKYFGYGMALRAEKLAEKPDEYISLTDPDPYVFEAISNPEKMIMVGSWKNSQFDELVSIHKSNPLNVEVDGRYYRVTLYAVDAFIWGQLMLISMVGWPMLGAAIMVWKLYMRRRYHTSRTG